MELEEESIKIANLDGSETEKVSVPGKFYNDGTRIFDTKIIGDATGILYIYEKASLSQFDELNMFFNAYIFHILGIGSDGKGRLYLNVLLDESENKAKKLSNYILIIDSNLKEIGRFKIETQKTPHEVWRLIRVSPEGHVYQLLVMKNRFMLKSLNLSCIK